MASGGGGQQFGGGSYGNPWGNSFGSRQFGGQSFGGQSFSPAGKIGYQPPVNRYQPTMAVDNNWYERGQGGAPSQGPVWPPGGIPPMPPAGPQPLNPDIPAGAGNPLYSPRPMMPPVGIPQMPQAPKQPSNPFMPAGAGNPLYSPQTGGDFTINGPMPTGGPSPIPQGPQQFTPAASPVNRAQQRQAPPGYYFAANGQMLNGVDPNSFNKGGAQTPGVTNIYGGAPSGFGSQGYVPGSDWFNRMVPQYEADRNAQLALPAPFGRYPDGTPMADPNRNFRADYRLQNPAFAGGWPGYGG